ncbi:alpha/beta fold hydrolase [Variovorax sp. MHTC-1]|uniref:alpha/beta hydrolase family protein n=1 Tax=Variovorax sp. MHTC-1 TaxID=2495593 RepID=UPI00163C185A|nr:alpha/beta fold hydrolase [Variovorax sp. MHTC-1]
MRQETLQLADGTQLALRIYEPIGPQRASVVIGGAMGVRQAFYEPFARWLTREGICVWTFDYRGSGDSRPATAGASLRGFEADLFDWARDYEAVIDAAKAARSDRPLYLLGHSLGAQLPGFLERPQQVDGLIGIAAGSGYWRENAPRLKRSILYFWFFLVPLATRLWGYFPGRKFRKVGDLPRGVILQWRRWCLNPRYSMGAEGDAAVRSYGRVRFPVLALSMTDDELMTLEGTQSLLSFYAGAPRAMQRISPADVQARRIGHFGFFREQFSPSLWPRLADSLHRLAALTSAAPAGVPHTTA